MNNEKSYYITAEIMKEYISVSDFLNWRGVKTIETVEFADKL